MRKLSYEEQSALDFLNSKADRSYCPDYDSDTPAGQAVHAILDSLVRKKRATVAPTDDGPRYTAVATF